jgi:hypothetical protein
MFLLERSRIYVAERKNASWNVLKDAKCRKSSGFSVFLSISGDFGGIVLSAVWRPDAKNITATSVACNIDGR